MLLYKEKFKPADCQLLEEQLAHAHGPWHLDGLSFPEPQLERALAEGREVVVVEGDEALLKLNRGCETLLQSRCPRPT